MFVSLPAEPGKPWNWPSQINKSKQSPIQSHWLYCSDLGSQMKKSFWIIMDFPTNYLPCHAALSPIQVPWVILKDCTSENTGCIWFGTSSARMLTRSGSFFFVFFFGFSWSNKSYLREKGKKWWEFTSSVPDVVVNRIKVMQPALSPAQHAICTVNQANFW